MMKKFLFFLCLLMVGFPAFAEVKIKIVTENLAPFNYWDKEDQKAKGFSVEVVQAVLRELELEVPIRVWPWARAYETAIEEPNVLIFSIGRSEEREQLFKWVGEIVHINVFLFKLADRDDINIKSLEEAKKYRIATVNNDLTEQYLEGKGFVKRVHLHPVTKLEQAIGVLEKGRRSLTIASDLSFYFLARSLGFEAYHFEKAFPVRDLSVALHMAFSKGTSDELVQRFSNALKKIKDNGIYDKIEKKYTQ